MRAVQTIAIAAVSGAFLIPTLASGGKRKKAAALVDVTLTQSVTPTNGFVDDPFLFDGAGGRLLYVNADAGNLAELRVIDLTQNAAQLVTVDISGFTTTPVDVQFVGDGDQYFVTSRKEGAAQVTAAVLDSKGKALKKFGPADDIRLTTYDGKTAVVLYSRAEVTPKKKKKKKKVTTQVHHTVELYTLKKKRIGKKQVLKTDLDGFVPKLDFKVVYFMNDYTRAVGMKGGTYDAKEDQRSPDAEGWYEVMSGTFSKQVEVGNVLTHARRQRMLAEHHNEPEFLTIASDLSGVERVDRDSNTAIALAEDFHHYDHSTLSYQRSDDGTIFFTIQIDPVNADAVARKKADAKYLDLYELAPRSKTATRRGRILLTDKRKMAWRATSEFWVVQPRHIGFDRGGKSLDIYELK
jgi:hypothetical protein